MFQRFRDLPDQGLYGVIGVLAVAALYVIGFVIKNSKNVSVDFVLFSAGVPLITLMVVMLLFGALLGVFLTLVLARRRRRPARAGTHAAHAAVRALPPVEPTAAGTPPPGSQPRPRGRGLRLTTPRRAARSPARGCSSTSSGPLVLTPRSRSTPSARP